MNEYRHSGTVPVGGAVLTIAVGLVAAVALGLLYPWLVHYIPIIYLNFLCTLALGCGIGYAVGKAGLLGHIRNNTFLLAIAVLMATLALYLAWVMFLVIIFDADFTIWVFNPSSMLARAAVVYEKGTWGLGRGGGNNSVSGIMLGIVWLIEAGVVYYFAFTMAKSVGGSTPYCENCSTWTEHAKSVRVFGATGLEACWQRAIQGELIAIADMPLSDDGLGNRVHLDLATCPKCQVMNVLALRKVVKTLDSKDNVSTTETVLAKNLLVNPKEAEFVRICGQEQEFDGDAESTDEDTPPPAQPAE